jgi:hypothetical protein
MRRPGDKDNRSELPPGGGAAARARQAATERGLMPEDELTGSEPEAIEVESEARNKKKKKKAHD